MCTYVNDGLIGMLRCLVTDIVIVSYVVVHV